MVDPIPPPSTPIPPPSSPSPVPLAFSPAIPSDTTSVFTLPNGQTVEVKANIPILTFARAVANPVTESKELLWANQQSNYLQLRAIFNAMVDNFSSLAEIRAAVTLVEAEAEGVYTSNQSNLNALNGSASSYNSAQSTISLDANAVTAATNAYNGNQTQANLDALNAAIDQYNADVATYNTQQTAYNNAVTTFNNQTAATFAGGSGSTNDTLNEINSQLINLGAAGTLPYVQQTLATPVSSGPLATIPTAPPAPATVTVPPTASTLTNDVPNSYTNANLALEPLLSLFDQLTELIQNLGVDLRNKSAYLSYVQYYLQGKNPTVQAAYILPIPDIYIAAGPSGKASAGSGAALTTLITTLSDTNLSKILVRTAETTETEAQILKGIENLASYFRAQMQFLGLYAARLTDEQLKTTQLSTRDPNSPVVTSLLGINLAQFIAQYAGSDELKQFIQQYVQNTFPKLTQGQQTKLAQTLNQSVQVYLTGNALTILAQTLGLPNLPNQLLASQANELGLTTSFRETTGTTTPFSFNEVLNNPYSVAQLKVYLSNLGTEASPQAIQASINQAIGTSTSTPGTSPAQPFGAAVSQGLANANVAQSVASQYGQAAVAFVQGEAQLGPGLEASAANAEDLKGSLSAGLANSGLSPNVINTAVNSTVQSLSSQDDFSVRQVRDRLAQDLQKASPNLSPAETLSTANQAVGSLVPPPPQTQADLEAAVSDQFTTYGPTKFLAKTLSAPPTIGTNTASTIPSLTTNEVFNQIHDLLFGSRIDGAKPSISALLHDYLSPFSKDPNSLANQQALDALRQALTPTYSLYAFNNSIREPANALIHSSQISPMYASPPEGTYKKSTDVILG